MGSEDLSEDVKVELECIESLLYGDAASELTVQHNEGIHLSVQIELQGLPSPCVVSLQEREEETVASLPRLGLRAHLPSGYPSEMATFEIECPWLSLKQLSVLCRELDKVYEEGGGAGSPVLLQWISYLRGESVHVLGIQSPITLRPLDGLGCGTMLDVRASQIVGNVEEVMYAVKRHEAAEKQRAFAASLHSCGVCFEEVPGHKAKLLSVCGHIFCKACLKGLCSVHITDGTVRLVKCPELNCGEALLPTDIQPLVEPGEFERYERVTLMRVLEDMSDIQWCPRCQAPCISDEDTYAHCPACSHSFCALCSGAWHPGAPCDVLDDKTFNKLQKGLDGLKNAKSKQDLDKKRHMQGLYDAILSQCGKYFCWTCNAIVQGYDHWQQGKCAGKLFPEDMNPNEPPEAAAQEGERTTNCPMCGELHIKANSRESNYVSCSCLHEYCFICLGDCKMDPGPGEELLSAREHFRQVTGHCKEYTTLYEERNNQAYHP